MQGFESLKLPPLVNEDAYRNMADYVNARAVTVARSDLVRYEVVARYGGVYLDTDVECFAPIDRLLDGVRLFMANEFSNRSGNYMFGATPNHPALWTIVRHLQSHLQKVEAQYSESHKKFDAATITGSRYFGSQIRMYPSELVIFPDGIFNPLGRRYNHSQVTQWPGCTVANHHCDGKWYDHVKTTPPDQYQPITAIQSINTPNGLFFVRPGTWDARALEDDTNHYPIHPNLIPPKNTVIMDIGAHIGGFTRRMAKEFPATPVFSFEPSPSNFELLRQNCEGIPGVTLLQKAVGATDGKGKITVSGYPNTGINVVEARENGNIDIVSINTFFDTLAKEQNIWLLKMDCEGGEWQILSNIKAEHLAKIRCIVAEIHPNELYLAPHLNQDKGDVLNTLEKLLPGFELDWCRPLLTATNPHWKI